MFTQLSPTMIFSDDAAVIEQRMKELGVYNFLSNRLKTDKDRDSVFLTAEGHLFLWLAKPGDSGYVYVYTSDPAEQLQMLTTAAEILSGKIPTLH